MPNIIKCTFDSTVMMDLLCEEPLVIPTLRHLLFGECEPSDDEILNHLSLPALETLSVAMHFISSDDLLRFMKRSAPPLQELAIGWAYSTPNSLDVYECLCLIPSIVRFRMWWPSPYVVADLFTALADSPSLLPNLQNLIVNPSSDISDSSWRTLVRALLTRRVQLRVLAVPNVKVPTAPDVLAALGELVVDGMQIYIGTDKSNFTSKKYLLES
ncbi:hypothetical protein B0H12DRAFT_1152995 [Mycena haematopus]|nr:hypothetical protein B0H12DRAFT_1152995 [Mycena haematopus]